MSYLSGPVETAGSYTKRKLNQNLAGNEFYNTDLLILLVKNMLCSKLHRQKGFDLILLAYQIGRNGRRHGTARVELPTLETTQGQIDGFFSQFPFKCYPQEVASVED